MAGTKRRGKGEGSVFYHKAAGRWVARLPALPEDPGGWKPKEQRFATRAEAEKALILWGTLRDEGTAFSSAKFTVETYGRLWLAEKKNGLRPKTEQDYRRTLELHVFPFLGATKLAQLSTQRVRAFRSALQEAGRSGSLVRRADLYLRMLLTAAVNEGLISHNNAARLPPIAVTRPTTQQWTLDEARAYLQAAQGTRWEVFARVALATGLRRGELVALNWQDVNLEENLLEVRHSVVEMSGRIIVGEPKTAASRRRVYFAPSLRDDFVRQRFADDEWSARLGPAWRALNLVFPADTGGHLTPSNVDRAHRALCTKAGVRRVRFHDIRHTSASMYAANGASLRAIADQMGHSDPAFTARVYQYTMDKDRRKVPDLEDLLAP